MSSECKLFWRLEIMLQLQCAPKLWESEEEWLVLHACGFVCKPWVTWRAVLCYGREHVLPLWGRSFPTQLAQCRMFVD